MRRQAWKTRSGERERESAAEQTCVARPYLSGLDAENDLFVGAERPAETACRLCEPLLGCLSGYAELLHSNGGLDRLRFYEQACGSITIAIGGGHNDAVGAVDELIVAWLHVDHEIAVDHASADHNAG